MVSRSTRFIALFLLLSFCSYGQAPKATDKGGYFINPEIKTKVDAKTKTINGVAISSMDFRIFENDSIIYDTYKKGKSFDECLTMTQLRGDTLEIIGFMGMFIGFGYQIALSKNTCVVRHFAKSDARTYKLHKTDSLDLGVSVPCRSYKLTLTQKPIFKKGEVVEGTIELSSADYYEVANGKERKHRMQLTGYFKTEPLMTAEEKHQKLSNKSK